MRAKLILFMPVLALITKSETVEFYFENTIHDYINSGLVIHSHKGPVRITWATLATFDRDLGLWEQIRAS